MASIQNMGKTKRKRITKEIIPAKVHSLAKESDRGCVILVTSILDEAMRQMHEACLNVNLFDMPNLMDTFHALTGPFGPLNGLFGKTLIAYAYGLISQEQYEALNLVRGLRNEAAHEGFEFSFGDDGITASIQKLGDYQFAKMPHRFAIPQDVQIPEIKRKFILWSLALYVDLLQINADLIERLLTKRREKADFKGEFSTDDLPEASE